MGIRHRCFLCGDENAQTNSDIDKDDDYFMWCPQCGSYVIPKMSPFILAQDYDADIKKERDKFAHFLFYNKDNKFVFTDGESQFDEFKKKLPDGELISRFKIISSKQIDEWYPKTLSQKIDYIMQYFYKHKNYDGQLQKFNMYDLRSIYLLPLNRANYNGDIDGESLNQINYMNNSLTGKKFVSISRSIYTPPIKWSNTVAITLLPNGIEHIEKLQETKDNNRFGSFYNGITNKYAKAEIDLMVNQIKTNPTEAIGKAKETVECCCKTILDKVGLSYNTNEDVGVLASQVLKHMKLTPEDISDTEPEAKNIKAFLGNLRGVVQNIAELRNAYGSGHGKSENFKGLEERYAQLAVSTSLTLVNFLWDSFLIFNKNG